MRIVINAVNSLSAGTLVVGKQFLSALSAIDHTNHYLVAVPLEYGYEEMSFGENVELKYYSVRKWTYKIWRLYQDFIGFKKLVNEFKADAVIILGNLSPVKLNIPTVVLFHNPYYVNFLDFEQISKCKIMLKKLEIFFFYLTTKQADVFIAQSDYMKERLCVRWNIPESKVKVIPNGVSVIPSKSIDIKSVDSIQNIHGKFKILYVSRYYPHKNHKFILELAKEFKVNNINDVVFIVTLNELLDGVKEIMKEINDNGLNDIIYNIGEIPQNELGSWYSSADVLFFPSYLETFGNPFVEAMSFGLPICAVDLPYARAICSNVALYYQKDSLGDALEKLLSIKNDSNLRKEMSNKSIERVREFPSWEDIVKSYLNIVEELIVRHKGI
jgi:glycosyltransferase involved in cell wall biosynthesis